MQSLKHIQETTMSDNGLYEVSEVGHPDSLESESVRLREGIG